MSAVVHAKRTLLCKLSFLLHAPRSPGVGRPREPSLAPAPGRPAPGICTLTTNTAQLSARVLSSSSHTKALGRQARAARAQS